MAHYLYSASESNHCKSDSEPSQVDSEVERQGYALLLVTTHRDNPCQKWCSPSTNMWCGLPVWAYYDLLLAHTSGMGPVGLGSKWN